MKQQQKQHIKKSTKRKRIPWVRLVITFIVIITIVVIAIFNVQASVVFGVLSIIFGLFQWLFPISTEKDGTLDSPHPQALVQPSISHYPVEVAPSHTELFSLQHSADATTSMQGAASVASSVQLTSLFHFNEPLTDFHEYYGRKRERTTLMSRVRKCASTSLVGPRKIGKTWLMSYLRLVIQSEFRSHMSACYVDASLPSCNTVTGFTAKILEELGMPVSQAKQGLTKLEKIVKDFKSRNIILVVCIDEFEGFDNEQEFDLSFFKGLRALTQMGLCLVVASKNPLIDIVGENGTTSGFFNVFEQLMLKPFSLEEAQEFMQAKGKLAGFTEQEQKRVLQYGQDAGKYHPLLLQLAGKLIAEDKHLTDLGGGIYYRPNDPNYWQEFEERLGEKYRGVVR